MTAILVAVSLLLLISDQGGFFRPVEQVLSVILNPIERASYQLGSNLSRFGDFWSDNEKLRTENAQLRQDLQAALSDQARTAELASRVDELERQLEFRKNPESQRFNTLNADVVNRDTGGANFGIWINKGSNENVAVGMTVVDLSGSLVGRVVRIKPTESYILLVGDNNIGVNVILKRVGADGKQVLVQPPVDGTAIGQFQLRSDEKIKISHIKLEADVRLDDWVFTSGIGNTFPNNLLLGKVSRVINQDGSPEKEATVKPIADLERLQQVLVLLGRKE